MVASGDVSGQVVPTVGEGARFPPRKACIEPDTVAHDWVACVNAVILMRLPISFADKSMIRSLLLASCLVLAAPAALAQSQGDAARGRQIAYTCQGCHGVTGYKNAYPNYHVPKIGGQSEVYLVNALTEYREGKRKHPTMQAQAESFSEQDVADIAAYLTTLK